MRKPYRMPAGRKIAMRPCHDCGRMIWDYRCPECWAKLRRRRGLELDAGGIAELCEVPASDLLDGAEPGLEELE